MTYFIKMQDQNIIGLGVFLIWSVGFLLAARNARKDGKRFKYFMGSSFVSLLKDYLPRPAQYILIFSTLLLIFWIVFRVSQS